MSEIKVNSVKGVAATTAALTINNTDGTCTANITNNLSNKNLIINGAMNVAQRSAGPNEAQGYGTVDRFKVTYSGQDQDPSQAQVDVASGTTPYTLGFRKALRVINGNQTSGAGANDHIRISTFLEGQDIANSGWNYVSSSSNITLSFWVKSSVAQNFYGFIRSTDGTMQQYPFETGSLSADTWTKVTKTIPGNSNLTFNNDTGGAFELWIHQFAGTDQTASGVTLNAWAAYNGNAKMPDFTSTWYTTNDATFELTGVQLEVGEHATDFEHRSFAQELALCQRYFYMMVNASDGQKPVLTATCYTDGSLFGQRSFPVTMRANPSVYQVSGSGYYRAYGDVTSRTGDTVSISVSGTTGCELEMSVSGTSVSRPYFIRTNDSNARIGFNADL